MSILKKSKEELELMSNKDIAFMILSERKRSINTADLYRKIMSLLELPESSFEEKIGEFYTMIATDKRFILLDNGNWDLRSRHSSDKLAKIITPDEDEEDDDDDSVEEVDDSDVTEEVVEDNYDATDDDDDYVDPNEELKDLVVIDEAEEETE